MPFFGIYAYELGVNVSTLLLIRFSVAALFLFGFMLLSRRRRLELKVRTAVLLRLFLLGLCYALSSTFYFTAVRYISPSLASLLLYTYPIIVILLDSLLEWKKPVLLTVISGGVSFGGVLLILGTSYGSVNGLGVLLALGTALIHSVYIILGHKVGREITPLATTTFVTVFSSFGIIGTSFFTAPIDFSFQAGAWGYLAGIIFFSTVIAALAFFRGLELLGPVRASILSMGEPLFTALVALLLLQERLTIFQILGGIAVLGGALAVTLPREQEGQPVSAD